ncbi:MAG: DUF2283 domain-containing protein [Terracidiphilus sp.]|nr:DUF2283 domain-containing protein [Terracidiphilus sp.]
MKISYAKHADVLYLVLEDTANKCAYIELESGVVCRIDETTDRVVGITIPDFRRRIGSNEPIVIPELPMGISAEKLLLASDE